MIKFNFEAENVDTLEVLIKGYAKDELPIMGFLMGIGLFLVAGCMAIHEALGLIFIPCAIVSLLLPACAVCKIWADIKELIKESNFSYKYTLEV